MVSRFLTEHFNQYVNYDFTANMEDDLDAISRGEKNWLPIMEAFWASFEQLWGWFHNVPEVPPRKITPARLILSVTM